MKWYKIHYNTLVEQVLPTLLRQRVTLAVLRAAMSPISSLYNLFSQYRKNNLYHLSITGQVFSLERMLNDRYDPLQRGIYIGKGVYLEPSYIYTEEEDEDMPLYTEDEEADVYIYTDGEAGSGSVSFIVYVPVSVRFDENEMRALINIYKLPSKSYTITRV